MGDIAGSEAASSLRELPIHLVEEFLRMKGRRESGHVYVRGVRVSVCAWKERFKPFVRSSVRRFRALQILLSVGRPRPSRARACSIQRRH